MRIALLAFGTLVVGLLAILAFDDRPIALPTIAPNVEPICADAMHGRPPDLSWVAPHRFEKGGGREIQTITPGELPLHYGRLVRVAGVLHAEFEWVALYPSRAAMEEHPWDAPWVTLDWLWPDEPFLLTRLPSISDRCVIVEGKYWPGPEGHGSLFNGAIRDVLRLDVWSIPHRPYITTPPPPALANPHSAGG